MKKNDDDDDWSKISLNQFKWEVQLRACGVAKIDKNLSRFFYTFSTTHTFFLIIKQSRQMSECER